MIITLIQISILCVIAYQDFKSRSVSVLFLTLLGMVAFINGITQNGLFPFLRFVSINLLVIIFLLATVILYFSIKNKKLVWVFDRYIGWGDIVFFVITGFLFSPVNFLLFFVFALMFSLLFTIIRHLFDKRFSVIPLAGIMALVLVPLLGVCLLAPVTCYSDYHAFLLFTQLVSL